MVPFPAHIPRDSVSSDASLRAPALTGFDAAPGQVRVAPERNGMCEQQKAMKLASLFSCYLYPCLKHFLFENGMILIQNIMQIAVRHKFNQHSSSLLELEPDPSFQSTVLKLHLYKYFGCLSSIQCGCSTSPHLFL